MITTSRAPRTQRLLAAAFVLSVLIHLFGGSLWPRWNAVIAKIMHRLPQQHAREQEVATSDVVRLEHRTVPRPAQASRARPVPRPVPRPVTRPAPPVAAVTKPDVVHTPKPSPKPAPTAPPELARHVPHAPHVRAVAAAAPPAPMHGAGLSSAELAQLNARFAKTIASSHTDLATIQKKTEEQPVATRHYPMQFAGLQATLERGEGYIEPISAPQRIGGMVWYYTHYTYMWPDGHLEDDDIPWPFRYPVGHDLFAMHIHLIPLQLPPPGYRLTRPLKPFLAHFLRASGQG